MTDLISRDDAIRALNGACSNWEDDAKVQEIIMALPSAEAVSLEEHIKELNDLAVEWKAKFVNAEKITDEIYNEAMAKVANECKECKERLLNLRPSAKAVQLKQTDTLIIADALRYLAKDEERHLSDRTRADALREQILKYGASMCHSAEAVQGEWDCMIADGRDGSHWYEYECSHCGEVVLRPWNFCPNCGAQMLQGGEDK